MNWLATLYSAATSAAIRAYAPRLAARTRFFRSTMSVAFNAFVNGVQQIVGPSNPLTVTVGANAYTLVGVTADVTNVSTAPNGVSGTLTFSGNVSVSDGTAGNAATAANASVIVRPSQRATTAALTATDMLTMACLLDAVAKLRMNAVPEIGGVYNCYLDPQVSPHFVRHKRITRQ